jgi:hypothetical protein
MELRRTNRPRACPFIIKTVLRLLIYAVLRALGNWKLYKFPGAYGDVAPLRSIPNSVVKRISGEDTLGVAPRENSSVPGYQYDAKGISHTLERCLL